MGATLLAVLILVLAFAGSGVASCCVLPGGCCPAGSAARDHDRPELKAPVPQCCQQLAPASGLPPAGKATQSTGASKIAVLSDSPAAAVAPRAATLAATAPAGAPSDSPPRSGAARAPPQA